MNYYKSRIITVSNCKITIKIKTNSNPISNPLSNQIKINIIKITTNTLTKLSSPKATPSLTK